MNYAKEMNKEKLLKVVESYGWLQNKQIKEMYDAGLLAIEQAIMLLVVQTYKEGWKLEFGRRTIMTISRILNIESDLLFVIVKRLANKNLLHLKSNLEFNPKNAEEVKRTEIHLFEVNDCIVDGCCFNKKQEAKTKNVNGHIPELDVLYKMSDREVESLLEKHDYGNLL